MKVFLLSGLGATCIVAVWNRTKKAMKKAMRRIAQAEAQEVQDRLTTALADLQEQFTQAQAAVVGLRGAAVHYSIGGGGGGGGGTGGGGTGMLTAQELRSAFNMDEPEEREPKPEPGPLWG